MDDRSTLDHREHNEALAWPDAARWAGRRVLVTGHTGFKGSWLSHWLSLMGAKVHGLALEPDAGGHFERAATARHLASDTRCDIRDAQMVQTVVQRVQPYVVFHLAAQALVRPSYDDPLSTLSTNAMGTAHVLQACRELPNLRAVVVVTTDKCYQNMGQPWPYRETDRLGGHDPYSASKACAELVTACFAQSYFQDGPRVATARAGNVIGGGDVCGDRLLPDAFRAWDKGVPLAVRHPNAVRPWQHVLDALGAYLVLAQALDSPDLCLADAYNFGPTEDAPWPVWRVLEVAEAAWGTALQELVSPSDLQRPEAASLRLDASMAMRDLHWRNRLGTAEAIEWTVEWERALRQGKSAIDITAQQIDRFMAIKEPNHGA
jgi:CDP-glucose 4,6-dehydratase